MADVFRWGIMAPGRIAHKFAAGVAVLDDARVEAVGSRSLERAESFAASIGSARAYGSYEELVRDSDVDAIYVASPHPFHRACTELALSAGKPVLCEKPLAPSLRDVQAMVEHADRCGTFLMEGMWTRFMPAVCQVREWLAAGRIGEVLRVHGDFSYRCEWNPQSRALDLELAGGGLLDVGVYPIWMAYDVFPCDPVAVESMASVGDTGVDEQASVLLRYEGGAQAVLTCGVRTLGPMDIEIIGTDGRILIPMPFWCSEVAILQDASRNEIERFEKPHLGSGFEYEASTVATCIQKGRLQCELAPWSESLRVARLLDSLRAVWGVRYPFE